MTDRTASRRLGAGILQLAVALLVATYALPYIYLLTTSLKPAADVLQIPPRFLPETLSVEN